MHGKCHTFGGAKANLLEMPERTKKEEEKRNFSTEGTEKERKERKTVDRWEIERRIERGGERLLSSPAVRNDWFPAQFKE